MQSLEGGVGQRRRLAGSNTALELAASRGSNGVGEEGGSGGADSDKGGGWRQRMVRTIVFVVMRIRAVAAGLGAMLGLGRWTKVGLAGWGAYFAYRYTATEICPVCLSSRRSKLVASPSNDSCLHSHVR